MVVEYYLPAECVTVAFFILYSVLVYLCCSTAVTCNVKFFVAVLLMFTFFSSLILHWSLVLHAGIHLIFKNLIGLFMKSYCAAGNC